MYRYFSLFWWAYAVMPITGLLLILNYLTGGAVALVYLFKIPLVFTVVVLAAFHLRYRLKITGVAILFGGGIVWATLVGALRGNLFSEAALTHVYMTLMPILAASFGYYFAKDDSLRTAKLIRKTMFVILGFSVCTLSLYFYFFYVTKQIAYFGFDSMLPLASAMLLADRQYLGYLFAVAMVFFSGKRAPMIAMLSPFLLMMARAALVPRLTNIIFVTISVGVVIAASYFAWQSGLLYRFEPLLELDITDYDKFYVATSGRSTEFFSLFNHLNADTTRWFTGSGFGAQYLIEETFRGDYLHREQHFLHMAVLTYLLVFGLPFVLLLLGYIGFVFWRNRARMDNFFYLAMLITFVASIFGAGMIVEPVFWFFLGANVFMARRNESDLG